MFLFFLPFKDMQLKHKFSPYGFTTIELLTAVSLLGIILSIIFMPMLHSMKIVSQTDSRIDTKLALNHAGLRIKKDLDLANSYSAPNVNITIPLSNRNTITLNSTQLNLFIPTQQTASPYQLNPYAGNRIDPTLKQTLSIPDKREKQAYHFVRYYIDRKNSLRPYQSPDIDNNIRKNNINLLTLKRLIIFNYSSLADTRPDIPNIKSDLEQFEKMDTAQFIDYLKAINAPHDVEDLIPDRHIDLLHWDTSGSIHSGLIIKESFQTISNSENRNIRQEISIPAIPKYDLPSLMLKDISDLIHIFATTKHPYIKSTSYNLIMNRIAPDIAQEVIIPPHINLFETISDSISSNPIIATNSIQLFISNGSERDNAVANEALSSLEETIFIPFRLVTDESKSKEFQYPIYSDTISSYTLDTVSESEKVAKAINVISENLVQTIDETSTTIESLKNYIENYFLKQKIFMITLSDEINSNLLQKNWNLSFSYNLNDPMNRSNTSQDICLSIILSGIKKINTNFKSNELAEFRTTSFFKKEEETPLE